MSRLVEYGSHYQYIISTLGTNPLFDDHEGVHQLSLYNGRQTEGQINGMSYDAYAETNSKTNTGRFLGVTKLRNIDTVDVVI